MAKKVVASLQTGEKKKLVKVIKAVRSPQSGHYTFLETMVPADEAKEFANQ